jgi:subtilisin family serine protease
MPPKLKKSVIFFFILFFFFKSLAVFGGEISPDVRSKLSELKADEFTSCLVVMKEQVDAAQLSFKLGLQKATRKDRHQAVLRSLRSGAETSQSELIDYLNLKALDGGVREVRPFWITNAVLVEATREEIERIASRPDVDGVYENYPISLVEPVSVEKSSGNRAERERYLSAVGAREAWKMGYTGKGRLLCNFDTGVDGHHPAVSSNWRGKSGAPSSACWFDPYGSDFPKDDRGHGTHTMGIMAGVTESDTFGVAYGAQWISAAVIDRGASISETIADIISAFEWAVDPDGNPETINDVPDVINNSWGVPKGAKPACDQTFWNAIDNVECAGVVVIFAAGNEGPEPASLRTPADRISSPTNCFSVGAVDPFSFGFPVAHFSSRGPSGCDNQTIKPELSAPGVGIFSSYRNGEYRLMSGTSMATPFVSGAVAILRQYNPNATVEQIKRALLESCTDLGAEGEDNDYGHGLIDIIRALEILPKADLPNLYITGLEVNEGIPPQPGEEISLVVHLKNSGVDADAVAAELSTSDSLVHVMKGSSYLGTMASAQELSNYDSPFAVILDPAMPAGRKVEFELLLTGQHPSYVCQLSFGITVGSLPPSSIATHDVGNLVSTISNFGQYGLGDGAFNPLGGKGWIYPRDTRNRLYEGAFLIGCGPDQVSDAARDGSGRLPEDDFQALPGGELSLEIPGDLSDQDGFCRFSDLRSRNPLGVEVLQRSFAYAEAAFDDFLILQYAIKNAGDNPVENAFVGLFFDWDISRRGPNDDQMGYDSDLSLHYQFSESDGVYLSLVPLSDSRHFTFQVDNAQWLYDGFADQEKYQLLSGQVPKPISGHAAGGSQSAVTTTRDWSQLASCGPVDLLPGEKVVVSFAVVGGTSLEELRGNIAAAEYKYACMCTGIDEEEEEENVPQAFSLGQNYPNPFNPSTTIGFELKPEYRILTTPATPGEDEEPPQPQMQQIQNVYVSLTIYNIRGQLVKTLIDGELAPGRYEVVWDGTDRRGQKVASGVYLYRLTAGGSEAYRKMILLK